MRESGGLFSSDDEFDSDPEGSKMSKSKFFEGLFPNDPDFEVTGDDSAEGKVQIAYFALVTRISSFGQGREILFDGNKYSNGCTVGCVVSE